MPGIDARVRVSARSHAPTRTATVEEAAIPRHLLTRPEVEAATFIDFEGRIDAHPVLLGIAPFPDADLRFRQVVIDERFAGPARARGLETGSLPAAIADLVADADRRAGPIVGWSHHEAEVVRAFCPPDLADAFAARYVSAIRTAARWRRSLGIDAFHDGERLAAYLRLAGMRVAPAHGPGRTGTTLAILGAALGSGQTFATLSPRRRARWTALLGHNRIDVLGMRTVCDLATERPMSALST